jgi:TolA-binding protein
LAAGLTIFLTLAVFWPRLAAGQTDNPAADRQFAAAGKLQNLESYDLAAEAWAKFLEEYPADPRSGEAQHHLGVCYYQNAQLEQARIAFRKVVDSYPKFNLIELSYLYLGLTEFSIAQAGQVEMYEAASKTLQTLYDNYPKGSYRPDALYYRGESAYLLNKREDALKLHAAFLEQFPDHRLAPEALYALGVTQEELGQTAAAAASFDRFLAKFPRHPSATEVIMRRGQTLMATGQFGEAAARFAAAAATPGFELADVALFRHAEALWRMKQYARAADLYESVRTKYPSSRHAAEAELAGGKCRYLAGDFARARSALSRVLEADGPQRAEAAHWTARSLLKEGQAAEALAVIEKALPEGPESPFAVDLMMDRADAVYEIAGRRQEAIGLYAKLAAEHPADPLAGEALYMAGFASLEEGRYQQALDHAETFLKAFPNHALTVEVTNVAAESNLQLRNLPAAEALYDRLLESYPDHADVEVWLQRRALAIHLGKGPGETIAALEPAMARIRNPDLLAEAHYLLGVSRSELKQYEAAARSLEASLAAQPGWRRADETLLALADAEQASGSPEKAAATVRRMIAGFPQSEFLDRAHYDLGKYSAGAGDLAAAAAAYQQLIDRFSRSPLVPHALNELGATRLNQKEPEEAEKILTRLIEEFPEHELVCFARYTRGVAREQLGKFAAAVEDLESALSADRLTTCKPDARYVLGLSRLGLKEYSAAAEAFRQLLEEEPLYAGADHAYYQWAWALELDGKQAEAAQTFARLAEKLPQSELVAEADYHVGEFHYGKKEYHEAAVAYYKAMTAAGDTALGEKAAHRLGWSYYHEKKLDDAEKTFQYQMGTYPQGPLEAEAAFAVAECRFQQGKFETALAAYAALEGRKLSNPDFQALAYLHAGQAAGQSKAWRDSLAWLEKFAKECADSRHLPEALYEQAWARQNLDEFDKAIDLYRRVIDQTDREVAARAQFMIGEIQFDRKEHSEAVKSFFKVLYGYGFPEWQSAAAFEAGRCFEVLEKKTQAVKIYGELIEKFPDSDKAPLARKRIEELGS